MSLTAKLFCAHGNFSCPRSKHLFRRGYKHGDKAPRAFAASEMVKNETDSRIIQQAIDAIAEELPASFILLRAFSFGHPEQTLRAWTPNDDHPPLEINLPVLEAERAVY